MSHRALRHNAGSTPALCWLDAMARRLDFAPRRRDSTPRCDGALSHLFVLRWYKEVDANGAELSGYQNKECKAYKLMRNNDGVAFRYTSQVQIISKVILKRHRNQAMTFTLNASDKKMVVTKRKHMD